MEKVNVSTPSSAYNRMSKDWAILDSVIGGTKAMRAAGQSVLPKHPQESESNYAIRLASAVLTPFYKLTLKFFQGRIFSKPLKTENVPEVMEDWLEDCDRAGNDLTTFAQEFFYKALGYGMGYILVDNVAPAGDAPATVEQANAVGMRPYFVHVPIKNVLGITVADDGVTIVQARIFETATKTFEQFGERQVNRVRVLDRGTYQVWEQEIGVAGQDGTWSIVEKGNRGVQEITLVPYFTGRTGPFEAEAPLLDLAHLNVAHYQMRSNHQNALTVAQFPMLAVSGWDGDDNNLIIGPKKMLISRSEGSKFYFVEHTGAAIGAGRQYLEDLKSEMALNGIAMLMPKGVGSAETTATEEDNRKKDTQSQLAAMADALCDCLEQALAYMAELGGIAVSEPIECSLEGSFDLTQKDTNDITNLMGMRTSGDITRKTLYAELKRRGFLSDSFDAEAEQEMLLNEPPDLDMSGGNDAEDTDKEPEDQEEKAAAGKAALSGNQGNA